MLLCNRLAFKRRLLNRQENWKVNEALKYMDASYNKVLQDFNYDKLQLVQQNKSLEHKLKEKERIIAYLSSSWWMMILKGFLLLPMTAHLKCARIHRRTTSPIRIDSDRPGIDRLLEPWPRSRSEVAPLSVVMACYRHIRSRHAWLKDSPTNKPPLPFCIRVPTARFTRWLLLNKRR
ncbi:hypothetical protein ACQJBY_054494 [Aegilops geniculata]